MARINRLRVVNFSYNGGERLLPDFRVDTKSNNTYINLHNGGGKTALIQIINQVILPLSSLGGKGDSKSNGKNNGKNREFREVFCNKKEPAYILIEWKLDNNDYATTGIAIKRKQNISLADDNQTLDNKNIFDYYTFVLEYTKQGVNDIDNIPIVETINGSMKVNTFQNVRNYIENIEVSRDYKRKVYNANSVAYANKLKEIGINPTFWKTVLNKINSGEGGLDTLFENSDTPALLIKNWLLPEIIKKFEAKGINNPNTLLDQIYKHINSVRKVSDLKKVKAQFEDFLSKMHDLDKDARVLRDYEMQKDGIVSDIFDIYFTYKKHVERQSNEMNLIEIDIDNTDKALEILNIEEICKEYYEIRKERLVEEEELESIKRKVGELHEKNNQLNLRKNSLEVARINKDIQRNEEELGALDIEIKKQQEAQDELQKEKENYGYTINTLIREKLDGLVEKNNIIKEELIKLEYEYKDKKKSKEELDKSHTDINREIAKSEVIINDAQNVIDKFIKEFNYDAGLFGLDESVLKEDLTNIESNIISILDKKIKLKEDLNTLELDKKNIEKSNEKLKDTKNHKEKEKVVQEQKYNAFENDRKRINDKLDLYNLSLISSKDINDIVDSLNKEIEIVNIDVSTYSHKIYEIENELNTLEHGGISVDKAFLEILEAEKINYNLGSEYIKNLKHLSREEKEIMLENNPLLPYAVIMKNKDIEYIKNNLNDFYNSQIILIIAREEVDNMSQKVFSSYEGINFLTRFNKDLLINNDIEGYKERLIYEKESLSSELEKYKARIQDMSIVVSHVNSFDYEIDFESNILNLLKGLDDDIDEIDQMLKDNISHIQFLEDKFKQNKSDIKELDIKLESLNQSKSSFESVIDSLKKKKLFEKENDKNKENLRIVEGLRHSLVAEIEDNLKVIEDKRNQKRGIVEDRDKWEECSLEYQVYESGKNIPGTIDYLIASYKRMDISTGKSNIDCCRKNKEEVLRNLKVLRENRDKYKEYYDIVFSKTDLDDVKNELSMLGELINSTKLRFEVVSNGINYKLKDEEKKLKKLKNGELIPEECISDNIPAKREYLKSKKVDLEVKLKEIGNGIEVFKEIMMKIEGLRLDETKYNESAREEVLDYLENPRENYSDIREELLDAERKFHKAKEDLENAYEFILKIDVNDNFVIDKSIRNLKKIKRAQIMDSSNLSEIINQQIKAIKDILSKKDYDFESLEKEKNTLGIEIKRFSKAYFEELNKIDNNNTLDLKGKKYKMMRISKVNASEINDINIIAYLDSQIERFENLELEEGKEDNLFKKIKEAFTVFNIMNNYYDLNQVKIDFVKVEKNTIKNQYIPWQELVKLSGGESFLGFFILFSSIQEYSSGDGLRFSKESLAMIMDNPFAAISSGHLLGPLFDFAKQKGIQLICLTDHDKKDILDRFDIVYKLNTVPLTNGDTKLSIEECEIRETIDYGKYSYESQVSFDV